jgi:hypothetical protein
MTKVFVSSTVYDLLDARSEVEALLKEMHLTPVLSESASASFQVTPDRNSIECCLANLRECETVILLLSQRYGRPLGFSEDPSLSATHLEYNEARRCNKKIFVYVRDRLEGEYNTFKANPDTAIDFRWSADCRNGLFRLLADHRRLIADSAKSNWFSIFRDSVELKQLVRRDLHAVASRSHLESLIHDNRIPVVTATCELDGNSKGTSQVFVLNINLRNCGSTPAYQCKWTIRCDGEVTTEEVPFIAPSQTVVQSVMHLNDQRDWFAELEVSYFMSYGHRVTNTYRVGLKYSSPIHVACGASSLSQTFFPATEETVPFIIAEQDTITGNT